MAYQKLQVERALKVIPSDTIDIPAVSGPVVDSTMTQIPPTTSTIVDGTQDFTAIVGLVGSPVIVGTSIARVASVTNATSIVLDAAIAGTSAVGYRVFVGATNPGCVLYAGNTGNIRVLTSGGDDVVFVGIPAGSFVPVQVLRVFATDTTATDIVALW
jgi:hypothetical protein